MALINCKECNKEISDTVDSCPHCGYNLKNKKPKKNMIGIIVVIGIVVISILTCIYISNQKALKIEQERVKQELLLKEENEKKARILQEENEKKEKKLEQEKLAYHNLIRDIYKEMNDLVIGTKYDATYSISFALSFVDVVWDMAIDNGKDFSTEVADLYKPNGLLEGNVKRISDFESKLDANMSTIQNYPEGTENIYNEFMVFYESYVGLSNQAKSPSGSLVTFRSDVKQNLDKFNISYTKLKAIIPPPQTGTASLPSVSQ